jgi:hypothetical protein
MITQLLNVQISYRSQVQYVRRYRSLKMYKRAGVCASLRRLPRTRMVYSVQERTVLYLTVSSRASGTVYNKEFEI